MALEAAEVRHVAMLARLALDEDELARFGAQLSAILDYAHKVAEVAAADVPPTSHPYPLANVLRDDDLVAEPLPVDEVLANAPDTEDQRFSVPPILAGEA